MPTWPAGSSKRKPPTRRSSGSGPCRGTSAAAASTRVTQLELGRDERGALVHDGHQPRSSPPRSWSQKKSREPSVRVTLPSSATHGKPLPPKRSMSWRPDGRQLDRGGLRPAGEVVDAEDRLGRVVAQASMTRVKARMWSLSAGHDLELAEPKTGWRDRTWSMPRTKAQDGLVLGRDHDVEVAERRRPGAGCGPGACRGASGAATPRWPSAPRR